MPPLLSKHAKIMMVTATVAATLQPPHKKRNKKRREWAKLYLRQRDEFSHIKLIRILDEDYLKIYLRMNRETFEEILNLVKPVITKNDTVMRKSVSAEERLIATLKYLASGREFRELKFSTSISSQLLSQIIPETCDAIYNALRDYIKVPATEREWLQIAEQFERKWQFDHCLGAIDGKHIIIEKPPNSGSMYYNYKGTFSIVLLGIVNANYEFIYINAGTNGSISDGGVFKHTKFYNKVITDELHIPRPSAFSRSDTIAPYCFVGDNAFAISEHILKPYPQRNLTHDKRIFNYRLSRARRIVENGFGILAECFRVFKKPITINVWNMPKIVMASCALHNFLRKKNPHYMTRNCIDSEDIEQHKFRPGDWRQNDISTCLDRSERQRTEDGRQVRQIFTEYFNGEGRVDFQERMINVLNI